ncbi:MAG: STN domain-containing protein [Alphaproteobacteria bacterium]
MPILCCAWRAWGRRLVLAACASVALAAGGAEEILANRISESGIQDRTWSFDIPPQSVISALRQWSAVTGRDWAYVGDSMENIRSPGVQGTLTGRQALDRLLAGTGLTYVVLPNGNISISRVPEGTGRSRMM